MRNDSIPLLAELKSIGRGRKFYKHCTSNEVKNNRALRLRSSHAPTLR